MKELVAYHEAGHAVVGALIPDYDQVTILPSTFEHSTLKDLLGPVTRVKTKMVLHFCEREVP